MLVFDLDPAPNVKWSVVVFAAHQIRNYLNKIHLQSFVKSTGGKGLHIVVPIIPEYDWKQIKNFCKTFVDYIVTQNPDHYTNKMTKSSRSGKIFIDYLRNQRGSTSIAPYSTRARDEAPVSVPLNWKELTDRYLDTFFTVKSLPLRLKKLNKDPWEGFFTIKQHLI